MSQELNYTKYDEFTESFCVFPALTYWEMYGEPVSAKKAEYGMHPDAVLRETEVSKNLWWHFGYPRFDAESEKH